METTFIRDSVSAYKSRLYDHILSLLSLLTLKKDYSEMILLDYLGRGNHLTSSMSIIRELMIDDNIRLPIIKHIVKHSYHLMHDLKLLLCNSFGYWRREERRGLVSIDLLAIYRQLIQDPDFNDNNYHILTCFVEIVFNFRGKTMTTICGQFSKSFCDLVHIAAIDGNKNMYYALFPYTANRGSKIPRDFIEEVRPHLVFEAITGGNAGILRHVFSTIDYYQWYNIPEDEKDEAYETLIQISKLPDFNGYYTNYIDRNQILKILIDYNRINVKAAIKDKYIWYPLIDHADEIYQYLVDRSSK